MKLLLQRLTNAHDATHGVLFIDGVPRFVTLELPWRENKQNSSRIPASTYSVEPYMSRKFGATWKVQNVPGREGILFHAGNFAEDTTGCILLGSRFGLDRGESEILASTFAISTFKNMLRGAENVTLEIKDPI